jgi:hypothetical protein
MSSRPSRRTSSRRSNAEPLFPKLWPPGVKKGLERLVADNAETVANMLQSDSDKPADLCEQCAKILQQQQLSPASFLARFFDAQMLAKHAELLGKSPKGTAPTLADRSAGEWAKNNPIPDAVHPKRKGVYEEVENMSHKKNTKTEKAASDKSNADKKENSQSKDEKEDEEPKKDEKKDEKDDDLDKGDNEKELPKEEKVVSK